MSDTTLMLDAILLCYATMLQEAISMPVCHKLWPLMGGGGLLQKDENLLFLSEHHFKVNTLGNEHSCLPQEIILKKIPFELDWALGDQLWEAPLGGKSYTGILGCELSFLA